MYSIVNMLAAASKSGTSYPPVMPQHRHEWPIRLGLMRGRNWLGALFLVFMALVAWTPEASAYDLYSGSDNNTDTGNCANCHGPFNSGT
jgi:hypothetical protein